jgi:Apea-like HEPN
MKYSVNQERAGELNLEALRLLGALAVEPLTAIDSPGTFRPNYLTTVASLRKNETPENPVNPTIGIDGFEVARFYPDLDPSIGLFALSHASFISLCHSLLEACELKGTISETFTVESCFEWMRQRHLGATDLLLIEYVLDRCERNVGTQEVWLPLKGVQLNLELQIGNVLFKPVRQADWRRWVSEWQTRQPTEIPSLRLFLVDVDREGISVAVRRANAEPIKAVEIALKETEVALDVLRYFSPSNRYPTMPAYCSIAGREPVNRPKHLIVQNAALVSVGTTIANMRAQHPWRIDEDLLTKMRGVGFDTLVALLNIPSEERSELQNDFLKALGIYSKSCIAQSFTDKLLYAVLTLECVLLKDERESLQKHIGERMAFMIGKSLEHRIAIVANYKQAYALRSGAVHHGREVTEEEILNEFMPNAWFTLNWIVGVMGRFKCKQEMIEYIDDMKFR